MLTDILFVCLFVCLFVYLFFAQPKEEVARLEVTSQPAFTCLKLTKETLEQGVKYVQSS